MPRLIKPFQLGVLLRPFEMAGATFSYGVTALASWTLDDPQTLLAEPELWKLTAERLGEAGGVVDAGIPKAEGEALVVGSVYAPAGVVTDTLLARVRVGGIDKSIAALGPRTWQREVPTAPQPFERVPLAWTEAFGGPAYPLNPLGVGHRPRDGARLPGLERPDQLIRAPNDAPPPTQLGPLDLSWPQRATRGGTYDAAWFERDYPGFPRDIDWRFFNLALDDQRQQGPFAGGETLILDHLHPTRPRLESALPDHRVVAWLRRAGGPLECVPLALTTVWIFPDVLRAVGVWHGGVRVAEDDARDIEQVTLAAEGLGAPRPVEHYEAVIAARLDRAQSGAAMIAWMDDTPLLPPGHRSVPADMLAENDAFNSRNLQLRRQHAAGHARMEAARQQVRELGVDPDALGLTSLPPLPPPPSLTDVPRMLEEGEARAAQAKRDAVEKEAAALAERARMFDEAGFDEETRARFDVNGSGPPKFDRERHREELRGLREQMRERDFDATFLDDMIEGPAAEEQLERAERGTRDGYLATAHEQPALPELAEEEARERGLRLCAWIREGRSVREVDFSGADLRAAALEGADLRGAWLESADLRGARLRGAQLSSAVLARARFGDTDLSSADLQGANLGACEITDSRLNGALLVGAQLKGSCFVRTDLSAARLDRVALLGLRFDRATLHGTYLGECVIHETTFIECSFVGLVAPKAMFNETDLTGANLSNANLSEASFVGVRGDGIDLREATLERTIFVKGTSLARATLTGARASGAQLRGCNLEGATLNGAVLDGADLSEANLEGAQMDGISARTALFQRANLQRASARRADLMEANLFRADVRAADLRDTSLFGADLARLRGDAETNLDGTLRTQARIRPVRGANE